MYVRMHATTQIDTGSGVYMEHIEKELLDSVCNAAGPVWCTHACGCVTLAPNGMHSRTNTRTRHGKTKS